MAQASCKRVSSIVSRAYMRQCKVVLNHEPYESADDVLKSIKRSGKKSATMRKADKRFRPNY